MSLNILESYEINGKVYVNTKFLSAYLSKSDKQIGRWKKDGCPVAEKPKELKIRGDIFILKDVEDWIEKNINQSKSRATQKKDREVIQNEDIDVVVNDIYGKIQQANKLLQLEGTTELEAERIKKILDGLIQAVKLGEQTKELIPKKDTETVIVEFATALISGYKRDIKILPKELKNKTENDIRKTLESTYKTNIEKFNKIAKLKTLENEKIYDIIGVALDLLNDNIPLKEIIEKLKG